MLMTVMRKHLLALLYPSVCTHIMMSCQMDTFLVIFFYLVCLIKIEKLDVPLVQIGQHGLTILHEDPMLLAHVS